jgi:hypothetical protein
LLPIDLRRSSDTGISLTVLPEVSTPDVTKVKLSYIEAIMTILLRNSETPARGEFAVPQLSIFPHVYDRLTSDSFSIWDIFHTYSTS